MDQYQQPWHTKTNNFQVLQFQQNAEIETGHQKPNQLYNFTDIAVLKITNCS